jgi:talin
VAGSTAQLLLACKVKADPDSRSMKRLEAASNAVRKATDELVKAAQHAIEQVSILRILISHEKFFGQILIPDFFDEITLLNCRLEYI